MRFTALLLILITSCGTEELTSTSFEIFKEAIEINPLKAEAGKVSLVEEKGEVLHYYKGEPYTGWVKMKTDPNYDPDGVIPVPQIIYRVEDGRQNGQSLKHLWNGVAPQAVEFGNWKDGLKHGEFREISYEGSHPTTVVTIYENGNFSRVVDSD